MRSKREWHSHIKAHNGYRSKFEADVAQQLEEAGVTWEYETARIPYKNQNEPNGIYIPDFKVIRDDGSVFFIEAKGWVNNKAACKMTAVKWHNPDLDIRFVFQSGTGKVAKLKSTNLQWAKRLRFLAAVKDIPAEWLAEEREPRRRFPNYWY